MKILIVDDVPEYVNALSRALSAHEMVQAGSLQEGMEKMNGSIEIALLDVRLSEDNPGNRDGIELLGWIREHFPSTLVVVMSAYSDHDAAVDALNLGAQRYLKKPIRLAELKEIIRSFEK